MIPRVARPVREDWFRLFGGITLPASLRAGWYCDTGGRQDGEFFRAEITAATFR